MPSTDTPIEPIVRYDVATITDWAARLLQAATMPADRAAVVARVLVEGDLLGHYTHGLYQLGPYLKEIGSGAMPVTGEPLVLSDRGAAVAWDGQRLPGPWLTMRAIDLAIERARTYGTASVAIGRSHHIACLAAYLKHATDQGMMITLWSSGPNGASVAPFGGTRAVFSPNPVAAGIPTSGDPILVDVSTSITTNGLTNLLHKQGRKLPHQWLLDADGLPSDDPAVLATSPKGTILPLGGLDAGHKGYGLTLLVEALTAGLAGHGRANPIEGWGASVFVQVLDPTAFGGMAGFNCQTDYLADACRNNPPRPGVQKVRLPGENGLARRREQLAGGLALTGTIVESLAPWANKHGVPMPAPLPTA